MIFNCIYHELSNVLVVNLMCVRNGTQICWIILQPPSCEDCDRQSSLEEQKICRYSRNFSTCRRIVQLDEFYEWYDNSLRPYSFLFLIILLSLFICFYIEGYYPVAFVGIIHFCSSSLIDIDENGQICKMKSGTISLEITLYLNPNVTNILHAPLLDSIGWFKTVKFHLVGKLKFHFFSETMPEIQPLERYSYVISDGMSLLFHLLPLIRLLIYFFFLDYDIEKLEKLASKNNTSVALVETIKNEKFEDELLTTVLEEEEVESLNQSMKRKRGRPSKTSSSDDNIPGEGVVFHEENVLCLPVKLDEEDDHGDDDNERGAKSSTHRNIILHRPWIPSLYILTTLNTIYTLSPALYGALLDDRERWAFLGEILHKQISDDEIEIKALPIQYSVSYFLHLKELKPKRLNQFTGARHRFKG